MSDQTDHDLLITIANDTRWLKDTLVNHMQETAAINITLERKVESAHKRIDMVQLSGILSIIVLALTIWLKK